MEFVFVLLEEMMNISCVKRYKLMSLCKICNWQSVAAAKAKEMHAPSVD